MPVLLNGVHIPDFPHNVQETCHSFTGNYLYQRYVQRGAPYQIIRTDSIEFLKNMIQLSHIRSQPIGSLIMQGDLIIIGSGRTPTGEIAIITHSMIAISPTVWFGCNNVGTFGTVYNTLNIPANSLASRREVDLLNLAGLNFNHIAYTFGGFDFDVLR